MLIFSQKKFQRISFLLICESSFIYFSMLYFRSNKAYNIQSLSIMLIRILLLLINTIYRYLTFNPVHSIEIWVSWGKLDLLPLTMFSRWPLACFMFHRLLMYTLLSAHSLRTWCAEHLFSVLNQMRVLEFVCFVVCFVSRIICYVWKIFCVMVLFKTLHFNQ